MTNILGNFYNTTARIPKWKITGLLNYPLDDLIKGMKELGWYVSNVMKVNAFVVYARDTLLD